MTSIFNRIFNHTQNKPATINEPTGQNVLNTDSCRIFYDAFYKCLAHKDTTVHVPSFVTSGFSPYECKQYTPSQPDILLVTNNYTYPYWYSDLMYSHFPLTLQFQSPSGTDKVIISTDSTDISGHIPTCNM
jgi:hypothetical protein